MMKVRSRCVLVALLLCGVCLAESPRAVSAGDNVYVVQQNDTLSSIALMYGTTVSALAAANNLQNADVIGAGDTLVIPDGAIPTSERASASSAGTATSYTVQSGDTLSSIALQYGVSVANLESANNVSDGSIIQVGQQLVVPAGSTTNTAPSSTSNSSDIESIITTQAQNAGVDVALVKAVAWQESGWQMVTASDGGIGVMQLMPDSVDWVSTSLLGYRINPYDPADNVRAGVTMLRYYLNRFGDVTDAVAAYHQGMVSVETDGISAETQHYVDNVLALQQHFSY